MKDRKISHKTLLLDQTYQPISILKWQRAMQLYLGGRAQLIEPYSEITIRSVNNEFILPAVLRLSFHNNRKYQKVNFSRLAVFARDNYTCAYCGGTFNSKSLSLDHVIPLSKGGLKNWHNIVTSCLPCNLHKGCRTPSQAGLTMIHSPHEPRWSPILILKLYQISQIIKEWEPYFAIK